VTLSACALHDICFRYAEGAGALRISYLRQFFVLSLRRSAGLALTNALCAEIRQSGCMTGKSEVCPEAGLGRRPLCRFRRRTTACLASTTLSARYF